MGALTQQLRAGLGSPPTWLREALGAVVQSSSGVSVTPKSAMTFAAFYAVVNAIATDVAKLPTGMYKTMQPAGRQRASEHPLDTILHDVAFEDDALGTVITAFHAKQYLQNCALIWGNGYAHIGYNGAGEVVDLLPLPPSHVRPYREGGTGRLLYQVTTTAGMATVPKREMFHLKSLVGAQDADIGISPITYHREALGLGLAQQEYLARFYGNDASPGGILTHPGRLKPEAKKKLKSSWEESHAPMSKKHRVAVLEEGITWTSIGMPLHDAQFLEERKFQVEEVARIFRVPAHKLQLTDKADKATAEQDNIQYVADCLEGWLAMWRATVVADLLMPKERKVYFPVFDVWPLLRGDFATRMNGYAVMLDRGAMNPDEVRDREEMNPIENGKGKGYYHALNMVDVTAPPPAKPPAPPPPGQEPNPKGPGDMPQGGGDEPAGPAGKGKMSGRAQLRSVEARRRYTTAHAGLLKIAAEQLVEREASAVEAAATLYLVDGKGTEFARWVEGFYRDFEAEMYQGMLPTLATLAGTIRAEAADEVGGNGKASDTSDAFVRDFASGLATRHVRSAQKQLSQLLEDGATVPLADEVRRRTASWRSELPDRIASNESVRLANGVALFTYGENGITQKRWVKANDCAWCDQLHDRVSDLVSPFLEQGARLQVEGQNDYVAGSPVGYGPLHGACSCSVAAVVGQSRQQPPTAIDAMLELARAIALPKRTRRETDFKREGNAIVGKVEVETQEPA